MSVVSDGSAPRPYGDHTVPLDRGRVAPLAVIVRVEQGEAAPARFRLETGSCMVGSAAGCDIVVRDRAVSRNHVELSLAPEGVSISDLGSRNGTFFAGQRVEKMVLGLGGRLTVGSTVLAVEADTEALLEQPDLDAGVYRGIVGESKPMRKLFALLSRLEGSLATILVQGESGVGKERICRALHDGSKVAEGPFVALNCGAFPQELIASELFGHKKGAFSGAIDDRQGAFQNADSGTLMLDEIGELPLPLQPMLLRALELGEVKRLGDEAPRYVKVRVVAATNRDLEQEVREGRFRQDLYYRLAVVKLHVPPLRERPADIEPLAHLFAEQAGLGELDAETLAELRTRAWPGNARELKNAIVTFDALGILPDRPSLAKPELAQHLAPLLDMSRPFLEQKDAVVDTFTKLYLESLMDLAQGNQSEAARMSGLNRTYLGRMLNKYEFDLGRKKGS